TGNVVLPSVVLLRISNEDFAVEITNAKRSVASRKVWVNEAVRSHLMKILIVGFDLARMKICYVQEIVAVSDTECCTFVNGAVNTVVRAVIDGFDRVRLVQC